MRRIAVFTGSRADYGLLCPVLKRLQEAPDVDLQLLVSGGHLAASQGMTVRDIEADGFPIAARVDLDIDAQPPRASHATMALALKGIGVQLERLRPHVLVILGDRYEALSAAIAATMLGIPLAHISGGDCTLGAIDDVFRHSITKMSHLHFSSCEEYRHRVIQLGEAPERVWNVGGLGVENVLQLALITEEQVRAELGCAADRPYLLCTFHPVTLDGGQETVQLTELLTALEQFSGYDIVFTGANADPGGNIINTLLAEWAERPHVLVFPSLGVLRYLSAAKYAACVVGNSSSGVAEIPSLGVPVLDIGSRQEGRIRSCAVVHCATQREEIVAALTRALTPERRELAHVTPNPYAGTGTSQRISHILRTHSLCGLLKKIFYDVPIGVKDE